MLRIVLEKPLRFLKSSYYLCVMLCLLSSSSHAFADTAPPLGGTIPTRKNSAVVTLTIITGDSPLEVNSSTGLCDFGVIDPLTYNDSSAYTIAHDFTLANNSKKAIIVSRVQGPDPRLTYDLPMIQKQLPVTVTPGNLITIQLYYKLLPLKIGALNVTASVFIANQAQPAATLELRGVLSDVVTFDPPLLDFGETGPGETVSKILKVVYNPHMYPSILPLPLDKLPLLASDQNFIQVKLITTGSSEGASSSHTLHNPASLRGGVARLNDVVTYLVTVKAPATGPFRGYLSILPVEGTIGYDVLKSRSVVVQGQVSSKSFN